MKKIALLLSIACLSSCNSLGLKRVDGQPQPTPAKSGVTWGGPVASGGGIQKGFWCDVKGGILTFGDSGPTEAQAQEHAMKACQTMIKDGSCKPAGCKQNP